MLQHEVNFYDMLMNLSIKKLLLYVHRQNEKLLESDFTKVFPFFIR